MVFRGSFLRWEQREVLNEHADYVGKIAWLDANVNARTHAHKQPQKDDYDEGKIVDIFCEISRLHQTHVNNFGNKYNTSHTCNPYSMNLPYGNTHVGRCAMYHGRLFSLL